VIKGNEHDTWEVGGDILVIKRFGVGFHLGYLDWNKIRVIGKYEETSRTRGSPTLVASR